MRTAPVRAALVASLALAAASLSAAIPSSERNVLITLYDTTNGDSWTQNGGWKGDPGTECQWYGVICNDARTTVTGLNLSWNNVAGPIPTSITNLPNLEILDFTANPLEGSLPPQVLQLSKVRILRLGEYYGSPLGGTIPQGIANLVNLEELDLSGNELTGAIPPGIANLPKLTFFSAWANHLSGEIPAGLFTHAALEYLDLSYNEFGGGLPSTISLPRILEIYLTRCGLSGAIPASLSLPRITRVELSENALGGSIPAALGQLGTLERLNLYGNQLTGNIPEDLGNLTNLTYLELGNNPFSGGIPTSIGNLKKLTYFSTYSSTLSGPIPDSLFTLTELQTLYLTGNTWNGNSETKLSGRVVDFTKLTKLEALDIGAQDITGPIPPEIAHLTELASFGAGYDPIGGSIPEAFGELSKLGYLDLRSTGLTGPIPESFGQLSSLHSLNLAQNALTSLPGSFSSLTALEGLSLAANLLSGALPASVFAQLPLLEYIDLRENAFSGPIPAELFALTNLRYLDLDWNGLGGTIPPMSGLAAIQELHIANNQLTGSIPADLGALTTLQVLRLDGNSLTGSIPPIDQLSSLWRLELSFNDLEGPLPDFAGLTELQEIHLSGNRFSGPIPDLQTPALVELDLEGNLLTGSIPASLGSLTGLERVNLASNALSGAIPPEIANLGSLRDNGLYLLQNALYNDDSSIEAFLDRVAPGFADYQTVAPADVAISAARERSLVVSWTTIPFTSYNGGYTISVATSPSGPFLAAVTTPDKFTNLFTLDGLTPSTSYFIQVTSVTYDNPGNRNTVRSAPSPTISASTTAGVPAPASVVILAFAGGLYQYSNDAGGSASYTLANVGDLPTTVTLTQEGDFFTQSPTSFTLAPSATQDVIVLGLARPQGSYTGASTPSGDGVPAGLRIPVRLLVTDPPIGTVNAVASSNRVDVSGQSSTTLLPASIAYKNTGTGTLTGIFVTEAPWIVPPSGIVTIPPGETVQVDISIDRTLRADASELSGAAVSSLSLVYPTGTSQGARSQTQGGSTTGVSLVTVVDTVTPETKNVPFPALQPGEVPLFLPGVGHVVGGVGLFLSDLSIINAFGTAPLGDIRVFYTPADGYELANQLAEASPVSPGQSFALADVVNSVFKEEQQQGTIQVRSVGWAGLVLNSNIFNVTNPRGTFGSSIPSFRGDRSIEPGASFLINGLKKDATSRTNVFIQETRGEAATADLTFYDVTGGTAGSATTEVSAFRLARLIDVVPEGAVAVRITNRDDSSGRLAAYATPVDQTSGDFWSLADWGRVYATLPDETQVIPVVGKVRGANNNFFRSDVSLTAADSPVTASIVLRYGGGFSVAETTLSLAAGETRVLDDVVGTLFPSLSGSVVGYLVIKPSGGALTVTSRTYATQDDVPGTFGTAVPTLPLSRTIRLGQSKIIAGLDVASIATVGKKTPATFRTNVFLVEAGGKPAKVRIRVVYADPSQLAFGSRLVTREISLEANQIYNANVTQLIAETNPSVADLRNVQLEFRVIEGDGAVFAFTSSIDNGTADQILRVE